MSAPCVTICHLLWVIAMCPWKRLQRIISDKRRHIAVCHSCDLGAVYNCLDLLHFTHFANLTNTDNKVFWKTTRRNQYRPRESVVVTLEQNSVTTWTAGQTDVGWTPRWEFAEDRDARASSPTLVDASRFSRCNAIPPGTIGPPSLSTDEGCRHRNNDSIVTSLLQLTCSRRRHCDVTVTSPWRHQQYITEWRRSHASAQSFTAVGRQ